MDRPDVIEGFFGVYLLYCQNPKYLGRTYIGYTTDPNRRINQHNKGHWAGGAKKTSSRGPWKMVMIIHGFPNNIAALRFEWAWQNPDSSRRLHHVQHRKRLTRKETALQFCLRILAEMLRVGPWCRLPLTIRWLAEEFMQDFMAFRPLGIRRTEGFHQTVFLLQVDKLPPLHMPVCLGPVRSVKISAPRSPRAGDGDRGKVRTCSLCMRIMDDSNAKLCCLNRKCDLKCHMHCLGEVFLEEGEYVPVEGECPFCGQRLMWGDLIRKMKGCNDLEDCQHQDSYHSDDETGADGVYQNNYEDDLGCQYLMDSD